MSTGEWIKLLTIPVFTGAIGWLINWTGLIMLFNPVRFHGVRLGWLADVATALPRRVQEIPGIANGGVGWQGIVPARAGKMGSLSVDKAISKLGTPAEFFEQLEPDQMAEHVVSQFRPEIPQIVERTMLMRHPGLWRDLPPRARRAIIERVQGQLPEMVQQITAEIGHHIDQLLDPKMMVVEHFERHPELVNEIFQKIGQRELRLMVNFGGLFGFLLGIPVAVLTHFVPAWWLLPVLGVFVGWTTNLLGMWIIFEPVEARQVGPLRLHGLFLRRQPEVADIYARIISEQVVTLQNIGDYLLYGSRGDRTRRMLEDAIGPVIDRAAGPAQPVLRVAVGTREYDSIRDSMAEEAAGRTLESFRDPEFSRRQSERMRTLIARRTREMSPRDYVEMLRSAIKEDEWMLYLHGAVMGLGGGFIHLAIFG